MSKLREKILNAKDIKTEEVTVEEWDVTIQVRGLTGKARAEVLDKAMDKDGGIKSDILYPSLLIASCYDPETGEKVFQPADRDALNDKSSSALEKLASTAMKLSGIGADKVKEAEKN